MPAPWCMDNRTEAARLSEGKKKNIKHFVDEVEVFHHIVCNVKKNTIYYLVINLGKG